MTPRSGIRAQFVAIMIVASVSFGILVLAFLRVLVVDEIEKSETKGYEHLLAALASDVTGHVLTGHELDLRILLYRTKSRDPQIEYLIVTDAGGRIIASSYGDQLPVEIDRILAAASPAPEQERRELLVSDKGRDLLHIALGLLNGQAGALHAGIDQTPMRARARRITLNLAALFLVLTVLGVGLAVIMGRLLTEPLRRMAALAHRVGSGDLSGRMSVESGDEVGQLARAWNEMTAKLDASLQALVRTERLAAVGRLAAGVAHEINNPVASLRAGLWALRKPEISEESRRHYLEALDDGLKRIAATVQNLLSFSRPRPMHRGPVRLDEVVERSMRLLEPSIPGDQIAIELDIARGLPRIEADQDQIQQVLVNLALNALHAIEGASGRGRIRIRIRGEAAMQTIEVEDDGPGIDAANREKVFDPFFSTRPEGKGTGLGLPVSRAIVEAHGGTLTLHATSSGRGVLARVVLLAASVELARACE